jgi:hypothetical protein
MSKKKKFVSVLVAGGGASVPPPSSALAQEDPVQSPTEVQADTKLQTDESRHRIEDRSELLAADGTITQDQGDAFAERRGESDGAQRRARRIIMVNWQIGTTTRCQRCKAAHPPAGIEVDHRIPLADGGTDTDNNIQARCVLCHTNKTRNEATHRRNKLNTTTHT